MRVSAPTMGVLGMGRLMVSTAMRVAAMVKRRRALEAVVLAQLGRRHLAVDQHDGVVGRALGDVDDAEQRRVEHDDDLRVLDPGSRSGWARRSRG